LESFYLSGTFAGYEDRLLLSHDWALAYIQAAVEMLLQDTPEFPNPYGFLYIKKEVYHQLREMGVPETTLTKLSVDNPRRFFEGAYLG